MWNVIWVCIINYLNWIFLRHVLVGIAGLLNQIWVLLLLLLLTLEKVEAFDGLDGYCLCGLSSCSYSFLVVRYIYLDLPHQVSVVIHPEWVLNVHQGLLPFVRLVHCGKILVFSEHERIKKIPWLLRWLSYLLLIDVLAGLCRLYRVFYYLREEHLWHLLGLHLLVCKRCGFPLLLPVGLVSLCRGALRNHEFMVHMRIIYCNFTARVQRDLFIL